MTMIKTRTLLLNLMIIGILAGCGLRKPTTAPSSTLPQTTVTDLPSLKYQLTYVTSFVSDSRQYQGIFAVDAQCLDKETPCFGSPELLLKIPKQSSGNPDEPYGEILTYAWSSDGKKIAFSAIGFDERTDVFISDWNGENMKNITMSSASEIYPSWSVDNQLIYTACDGRCHAVISDGNGKDATTFPFSAVVVFATWMPDGKQVLFVGADDKSVYQIYTANISGSDIKQITHTVENNIVEGASTNGELIFFTRSQTYVNRNFNSNIFSIDIEGKSENTITVDKDMFSFNPTTAPFGNWIAFVQGRDLYDIYISSFDGRQISQVTRDEGNKAVPGWRVVTNP